MCICTALNSPLSLHVGCPCDWIDPSTACEAIHERTTSHLIIMVQLLWHGRAGGLAIARGSLALASASAAHPAPHSRSPGCSTTCAGAWHHLSTTVPSQRHRSSPVCAVSPPRRHGMTVKQGLPYLELQSLIRRPRASCLCTYADSLAPWKQVQLHMKSPLESE